MNYFGTFLQSISLANLMFKWGSCWIPTNVSLRAK